MKIIHENREFEIIWATDAIQDWSMIELWEIGKETTQKIFAYRDDKTGEVNVDLVNPDTPQDVERVFMLIVDADLRKNEWKVGPGSPSI